MMEKIIISLLLSLLAGNLVDSKESVKCGSKQHWQQWIKAGSNLSSMAQDLVIQDALIFIVKAQGDYFSAVQQEDGKSIGVRAYEQLELFGKKLEKRFNCSDGLSWVEQMAQTKRAFDCGTYDCSRPS